MHPLGNLASRDGTAQRIGLLSLSKGVSHGELARLLEERVVLYMSHLPRIRIMADYAAEIEVRSDGEAEREELTNYDEVQDYLAKKLLLGKLAV